MMCSGPLWRFARDHGFRPRPARDGWWREDRKIGVAAREAIEDDLAIPYGCKFTAQEAWRRTMLGGPPESVNNTDARARLECGDEIVEQGVRLCDLVIHVGQDRNVEGISWQPRIVRLAEPDCDILQSKIAHPSTQSL